MKLPIFMDNHSTTRVDPRVVEAMLPYFTEHYGNAASRNHAFGWYAEAAVERAREQVAALIGGSGKEIVFTSGATESDNLAIKGAASFHIKRGKHIVTVETEHKAVLDTCKRLEREGILERRAYQQRPPRYEYLVTAKGRDLLPVLIELVKWANRHIPDTKKPPQWMVEKFAR